MDNLVPIIIYCICAILTISIVAYSLTKLRSKKLTPSIIFLFSMVLIWEILSIVYLFPHAEPVARLLFDLKLPFVAFTAMALLLFVMRFYSMDAYITPPVVLMLCVIPVMTIFMSVTTNSHNYLRDYVEVFDPTYRFVPVQGIWYALHTISCYCMLIAAYIIVVVQHHKMPPAVRKPSRMLLIGILVSMVANLLLITDILVLPVDLTLVGMSISTMFLFIAILNNPGTDFLLRARNSIFNNLSNAIFILDNNGFILSQNPAAIAFADKLGIDKDERCFDTIKETLAGKATNKVASADEYAGVDYSLNLLGIDKVFNLKEQSIFDNRTNIGTLIVVVDVTDNRILIKALEAEAGMDALTGLAGRMQAKDALSQLEEPDNWPYAILKGNVDSLKQVNAKFGHQQGDIFLRVVANTLIALCPPNALVARVGGDEFLILIPHCSSQRAAELVTSIKKRLKNTENFPFHLSMALGFAVKSDASQSIDSLMHTVDRAMQADKAFSQSNSLEEW